eukprot:6675175-Pyramimonas_sp.AAC.1
MDVVTFLFFSLQNARQCGWKRTPTGVVSLVSPSSSPSHDSVVGRSIPHHGSARGCAAVHKNPRLYGVSRFLPYDMDQGLDFNTTAAAPCQRRDADEGSAGVDLVDIDALPVLTQTMQRLRCQSPLLSDSKRARPPSRIY